MWFKKWAFTQKKKTELPQASYFTTAQTSQNAEKWCISPYYLFSSHLQDTFYSHLLVANSLIASSCDNNPVVFLFAQRGKEDNCFVDWSVFLLLMLCCAKHTVSRRFLLCVVVLRVFVLDPQDRQGTFFHMLLVQKETVERLKSQQVNISHAFALVDIFMFAFYPSEFHLTLSR